MSWSKEQRDAYDSLSLLKMDLAELLGWPYLENLSWYQTWPGGWCIHGRASGAKPQDSQRSMNFEIDASVTRPNQALAKAMAKVRAHPERLQERVRWYCEEHGWEEIHPRGVMIAGCPTCGMFQCEVLKPGGA